MGRSAAARALDAGAIRLAVIASVRHQDTRYDELLMARVPRQEARDRVRPGIDNDDQEPATWYRGSDVILAVEVVLPSSLVRDRERKPQIYAKAAIKHLWRIENEDGRPLIYTSELDVASGAYVVTGIFHDHLKLSVPFPIDLDLVELTR